MSRPSPLPFFVSLASLLLPTLIAASAHANSKRIVCVSADEDAFTSGVEGYYRSLPPKQHGKPDDIRVGGSLEDCMAKADAGDQVVIVAHGSRGRIWWRTTPPGCCLSPPPVMYTGFGGGTGVQPPNPHPVPTGVRNGPGIKVTIVTCHSDADPDDEGPQKSTAQSLRDAFTAQCGGCSVAGYEGEVNSSILYHVANAADPGVAAAAEDNLSAKRAMWVNKPPANSPNQVSNQKTEAEATLNAKAAFAGLGLVVNLSYGPPVDKFVLVASTPDSLCGGLILTRSGRVPGLGGFGLVLLPLLLTAFGALPLFRRVPSPPRVQLGP